MMPGAVILWQHKKIRIDFPDRFLACQDLNEFFSSLITVSLVILVFLLIKFLFSVVLYVGLRIVIWNFMTCFWR